MHISTRLQSIKYAFKWIQKAQDSSDYVRYIFYVYNINCCNMAMQHIYCTNLLLSLYQLKEGDKPQPCIKENVVLLS